jgi:hypothetical protein
MVTILFSDTSLFSSSIDFLVNLKPFIDDLVFGDGKMVISSDIANQMYEMFEDMNTLNNQLADTTGKTKFHHDLMYVWYLLSPENRVGLTTVEFWNTINMMLP